MTVPTDSSLAVRRLMADATRWRLAMMLDGNALEAVAWSPGGDDSFIHRRLELDTSSTIALKALEDAVYDTPLLLADYGRVDILVDGDPRLFVPAEALALDDDSRRTLVEAASPGFTGEILCDSLPAVGSAILSGIDRETLGFLRRTFVNPRISSRLTPPVSYFAAASRRSNSPGIMAVVADGRLDIVAIDGSRLLLANTFRWQSVDDALYYILCVRREATADSAAIYLGGNGPLREELAGKLRRFVTSVMPLVFPSEAFRTGGREAMESPFELVILPLCE